MDNFIHSLSTVRKLSYKLIHSLSTAYPQLIHSLSTGLSTGIYTTYQQVIHSAHLSVIKLNRFSTGYPQCDILSYKTKSSYPQLIYRLIHSLSTAYPQLIHILIFLVINLSTGYPHSDIFSYKTLKLSTGYPQAESGLPTYPQDIHTAAPTYPQDIHRLIHNQKSYPQVIHILTFSVIKL